MTRRLTVTMAPFRHELVLPQHAEYQEAGVPHIGDAPVPRRLVNATYDACQEFHTAATPERIGR